MGKILWQTTSFGERGEGMEIGEFVALFLDEYDVLVANWHKKKKGFHHHDARRLVRTGVINVLVNKPRKKLGRPPSENQEKEEE